MKGRRVYPNEDGELWLKELDYGMTKVGVWMARPPGCHAGSLEGHSVTEHEDGTITVDPSILLQEPPLPGWHGYLVKGEWEVCK